MARTTLTFDDVDRPAPEALEALPTLHVGQYANLKREEYVDLPDGSGFYLVRWWLNRGTAEDGFTHAVEVEARRCPNGSWEDIGGYGTPS